MGIGDDPVDAAKRRRTLAGSSGFPAANNFMQGNPSGAMTSFGPQFRPANIPAPKVYQSGSIGGNLGNTLGGNFTNPFAALFNQMSQNQQLRQNQTPTLSAYHWRAGSGGVQGGNDAAADVTWSNGTTGRMPGGVNDFQLGMNQPVPQPQYPKAPDQYPTTANGNINYNVPGGSMADALNKTAPAGMDYNAGTGQYLPASTPGYMSATKGPSQFASMPVTTNQFGQNMINSPNGGQMTTDKRQKPWLGGY